MSDTVGINDNSKAKSRADIITQTVQYYFIQQSDNSTE